jgi:hypothetical protein
MILRSQQGNLSMTIESAEIRARVETITRELLGSA